MRVPSAAFVGRLQVAAVYVILSGGRVTVRAVIGAGRRQLRIVRVIVHVSVTAVCQRVVTSCEIFNNYLSTFAVFCVRVLLDVRVYYFKNAI